MSKQLEFEYEFIESEDKKFGSPDGKGWNGLIKMLLESVSNLAILETFEGLTLGGSFSLET